MQALRGVRARLTSIRQVSRTVFARGSPFRWTLSALVWLPLAIFVTEYGVNVKVIVGRSMQVRIISSGVAMEEKGKQEGEYVLTDAMLASLRLTRTTLPLRTSPCSTASRYGSHRTSPAEI